MERERLRREEEEEEDDAGDDDDDVRGGDCVSEMDVLCSFSSPHHLLLFPSSSSPILQLLHLHHLNLFHLHHSHSLIGFSVT